jgi:hypothetical protein
MKKKTPVKKANKMADAVSVTAAKSTPVSAVAMVASAKKSDVAAAKSAPESGVAKVASAKKSDETEDDSTVVVDVSQAVEPGR